MTEIVPFRGIYYDNTSVAGDDVVAPPYDVITPEMKEALYKKSSYNIVRIDFGMELPGDGEKDNKYTRAARDLEAWLGEGVLRRSEEPTFYVYRMEYEVRGERKSLTGFYGLVKLVPLGEGVYPHEATHSKPKQDRLKLMRHTGANTSSIYSLINGQGTEVNEIISRVAEGKPYLSSTETEDGTVHSFWVVDSREDAQRMQEALKNAGVFIADGHHRYETALAYQKEQRQSDPDAPDGQPYDYVLMFLADMQDEGLTALPTHRIVTVDLDDLKERLSAHFDFEPVAEGMDIIEAIAGRKHTFGLYADGDFHVLVYKGNDLPAVKPALKELDVVILHKLVFGSLLEVGNWGYEKEPEVAVSRVDSEEYDAAFFLNPTAVEDVERVALEGLRMPPKSTYFYPKVQTGFVLNNINNF